MNRYMFRIVCTALWGPQYRSPGARQLGVHLRTLMRYDSGERAVPRTLAHKLNGLLHQRQRRIAKLLIQMREEV